MIAFNGVRSSCDMLARNSRLVLVGDLELPALVLDLAEEAHVLQRDRGLVAEGPQQGHFPVGERPHFLPAQQDRAERLALAVERRHDDRAVAEARRELLAQRVLGPLGQHVAHLDRGPVEQRASGYRVTIDRQSVDAAHRIGGGSLRSEMPQHVAVGQVHRSGRGVAKARRAVGDRIEHRLHVGRRARYHAQDFADRGLLFERFPGLVEEAHVVDGDRGLPGKGLQQRDLIGREGSRLATPEQYHAVGAAFAHERHGEDCAESIRLLHRSARRGIRYRCRGTMSAVWTVSRSITARPIT